MVNLVALSDLHPERAKAAAVSKQADLQSALNQASDCKSEAAQKKNHTSKTIELLS
ncbi:MAG: hypothetical protein LPK07_01605 [Hymenobacteraceae bacterium]|nr:hypothetical protein [Hymenobacteraceae bacterium]MDX5480356.1 hypothetical protein [Hymenobacteraceae bacterium]